MLLSLGAMAYLKSVFARASRVRDRLRADRSASRGADPAIGGNHRCRNRGRPGFPRRSLRSHEQEAGSFAGKLRGLVRGECRRGGARMRPCLQHQQHYSPLEIRMGSVYATNFASNAVFYVMMASMFFHLISTIRGHLAHRALLRRHHVFQPDHAAGGIRCQRARQGGSAATSGSFAPASRSGGGQFDLERGRTDLCRRFCRDARCSFSTTFMLADGIGAISIRRK